MVVDFGIDELVIDVVPPVDEEGVGLQEQQDELENHLPEAGAGADVLALLRLPLHFFQLQLFNVSHDDQAAAEEAETHVDPEEPLCPESFVSFEFQVVLGN